MMRLLVISLVTLGTRMPFPGGLAAQDQPGAEDRREALRVFLDCTVCDFDFVRRSIGFVDWVRDRQDAAVHVLVTAQSTGAGGTEFILNVMGRQGFESVQDTIRVATRPTDTPQEVRETFTHTLELALARFVAGTALGRQLRLVFEPAGIGGGGPVQPRDDPWHAWVFSVGLDGFLSGQEATQTLSVRGSLGANHTTENWKIRLSGRGDYTEDTFELSANETLVSKARTFQANALVVRSIGNHWSVGFQGSGNTSTFFNTDRTLRFAPAVEYSVFPYAESSERNLRAQYSAGVNAVKYTEQTIYGVTRETLYNQRLAVTLDLIQPWGSAQFSLEAVTLLDDLRQHRASLSAGSDWRIFRGLSFTVLGHVARIADQRSLPAGGVTDEEILLRRRELATSFDYSISVGFGFRFGSRFANVVNPRFNN